MDALAHTVDESSPKCSTKIKDQHLEPWIIAPEALNCSHNEFAAARINSFRGCTKPLLGGMVLSLFETAMENIPCQYKKTRL
jgi:hypothetical protein